MAEKEIRFIYPEEMKYDCIMCGECCSDVWDIPIDNDSYERLSKQDWSQYDKRFLENPPFRDTNPEGYKRAPEDTEYNHSFTMADGRCCFLKLGNKCLIHEKLGHDTKAQICKEFPFRFIDTPDGSLVGISFGCSSVIKEKGKDVNEYEDILKHIYPRRVHRSKIEKKFMLSPDFEIDWNTYLRIEKTLSDIIAIDFYPLELKLIAGHAFLNMLVMALKQMNIGNNPDIEIIDQILTTMSKNNFGVIFNVAGKMKGSDLIKRMVLGILLSVRGDKKRRRGNISTLYYMLKSYTKHAFQLGSLNIYPIEASIKYKDLKRIRYSGRDQYFDYFLSKYINHLIFRKEHLLYSNVLEGYNILLIYFALAKWYAKALAGTDNLEDVSRLNLQEAVSLVERYYVFHTNFKELFSFTPILKWTFQNVFDNKVYPATITMD